MGSENPGTLRVRAHAALLLLCGGSALAGDYHRGSTLTCSQCHVMHYSQSHGAGPPGGGGPVPLSGGPHERLLRQEVNDLCLACHDNNPAAADVLDANTGRSPADIRLAGFLNRLGGAGRPGTGHTLDSLDDAPGSSPPWKPEAENGPGRGLNCVNCHHPHGATPGGESAYRNLRTDPGNASAGEALIRIATGVNDLTRDVFQREPLAYDESRVDFNEPDPKGSAYGSFCGGCHTLFHGSPGDPRTVGGRGLLGGYEGFVRHPSAGVDIGSAGEEGSSLELYASRANKVKVMSASGVWDPPATDVTPTCFSCHKAHGNANPFAILQRSGTGLPTENGDTGGETPESLCGQCHPSGAGGSNFQAGGGAAARRGRRR